MIRLIGNRSAAFFHAFRFIYLILMKRNMDPELSLLRSMLKTGDIAVDVGANSGNWTYKLFKHVGCQGEVYSFEADPYYALATHYTIKLMHMTSVHFFHFGLSNQREAAYLRVYDSDGHRFSGQGFVEKKPISSVKYSVPISLTTLDSMLSSYPKLKQTRLIKCDVEGYELYVLQGAKKIIETARPIIILEIGHFDRHGYSSFDLYNYLTSNNYLCFAMINANSITVADSFLHHDEAISENRIMIPKEEIQALRHMFDS